MEPPTEPPSPTAGSPAPAGGRVAAAAGIMVAAILASRILALVRDMIVSYYFGAGMVTDAYNAAFRLPDLMYFLIAGGALSSAFIPVFTEYLTKGDEDNAWKVFSVFGTVMAAALIVLIIAGEIFTPWLVKPLAPGFDPKKLDLTVSLTRIVFPAQLFFFLGGLMMSTLYARNHFLMPALGPLVYNIAIIIGGMIGGALFGPVLGIYGLAWGVVVGSFLGNVVMQLVTMRRIGVRYVPGIDVRHPGVVKVARLMLPVILGLSLPFLCMILTTPFASGLGDGPVTWLGNANKVMQLPLGIFAQGLSVAIFPTLSALAAQRDFDGLRKQFSLGLRSILFLTIPSAVLIAVLAEPITAVLFQRGMWTYADTQATAAAVICYALAIFAVSGQQIVNRGFYSMQNTLTPMLAGSVASVGFLLLNCVLVGLPGTQPVGLPFGAQVSLTNKLALSYSIAMILYLAGLLVLFRRSIGGLNGREILSSVGRVTLASVAMGLVALLCKLGFDQVLHFNDPHRMSTMRVLIEVLVCSGAGGVVYLAGVKLLRVPEAEFVMGTVTRRFGKLLGRRRGSAPAEGASS
jgi:putative peptidoglycan lipid II flippase